MLPHGQTNPLPDTCVFCLDAMSAGPPSKLFHETFITNGRSCSSGDVRASTCAEIVTCLQAERGIGAFTPVMAICGHAFHAHCLREHLVKSDTNACPCCASRIAALEPTTPFRPPDPSRHTSDSERRRLAWEVENAETFSHHLGIAVRILSVVGSIACGVVCVACNR